MNKFLGLLALLFTLSLQAQIQDPVSWEYGKKDLGNNQVELTMTATIEKGWHLYAIDLPDSTSVIPTGFTFEESPDYRIVGATREPEPIEEYDPNFEEVLKWHKKKVTFRQTVEKRSEKDFSVKGELVFMTCNESMCLPPEYVDISWDLKGAASSGTQEEKEESSALGSDISGQTESGQSKIFEPVKWEYGKKELEDNKVELTMTATMDEGWHLYAINLPDTTTVIPTSFTFEESPDYELVGDVEEPKPIEEFDPNFEEILKWHDDEVTFRQVVEKRSADSLTVKAELVFMTCDASRCLPPEYVDISWELAGASAAVEESGTGGSDTESQGSRSLLTVFILSFLGGFAALLTPCVFPMIPLTVSFFTKQSKDRAKGIGNAVVYGIAIVALYTLLGFAITKIFGADALNVISTNPYVNIAFFVLLVVFAISFFGAFEITLPSSWVNKADSASDKGGILGIMFMALTLALVSFSCTGPIIGTLLFEAASGGVQGPLVGMFGFSLALALPFTLFAAFPGWLNSLPKSGGWLNSVKVVLGFVELAFAFKFLSNADLVWDAGLLLREHFIAIWIAIFLLLTIYLLGGFRMPHDSKVEKINVFRLLLAVGSLYFVIYLMPGLWGAPLKMIAGFPPPKFYSEAPKGFNDNAIGNVASTSGEAIPEGANPEHCPLNLNCFHEFDKGLAYAKKSDKPILLDFTGRACVNCRKMERNVWSDPRVLDVLRNDVVVISLYVDLLKKLPEDEQYVSDVTGKKVKTVGNKWSEFQVKHYQNNSQPQYVIIGHDSKKPLVEPTAYDPDVEKYLNWLKSGIKEFEEQS